MKRLPPELLTRMGQLLAGEDRDEMAIPSYLHSNPALRWMAWRRLEVIAQHLADACSAMPRCGELTVMDFGCGTGVLFEETARHAERILGVDLVLDAARLLTEERKLAKVTLQTPTEAKRAIGAGELDVILAAEVLEHVEPLGDTLDFFRESLASDGRLLVSLPTESALYRFGRRLAGFEGHYHHSNARSIDAEIRSSGFVRERLGKVPAPGPLAIYWIADYRLA